MVRHIRIYAKSQMCDISGIELGDELGEVDIIKFSSQADTSRAATIIFIIITSSVEESDITIIVIITVALHQ